MSLLLCTLLIGIKIIFTLLLSLLKNAGHLEVLMALRLKGKETDLKGVLLFPECGERKEAFINLNSFVPSHHPFPLRKDNILPFLPLVPYTIQNHQHPLRFSYRMLTSTALNQASQLFRLCLKIESFIGFCAFCVALCSSLLFLLFSLYQVFSCFSLSKPFTFVGFVHIYKNEHMNQ